MPGADDVVPVEAPLAEGTAHVVAGAGDRGEGAVAVDEGDGRRARADGGDRPRAQVLDRPDVEPLLFSHGSSRGSFLRPYRRTRRGARTEWLDRRAACPYGSRHDHSAPGNPGTGVAVAPRGGAAPAAPRGAARGVCRTEPRPATVGRRAHEPRVGRRPPRPRRAGGGRRARLARRASCRRASRWCVLVDGDVAHRRELVGLTRDAARAWLGEQARGARCADRSAGVRGTLRDAAPPCRRGGALRPSRRRLAGRGCAVARQRRRGPPRGREHVARLGARPDVAAPLRRRHRPPARRGRGRGGPVDRRRPLAGRRRASPSRTST